ncbi:MAG: pantoate--beta-alanine ligase [Rhizobiales bacterium 24-66-13]|jgi:pantoate--beta-alanine ligase|nr:MAG: pantoate--beta-alanine ligase [Rhizobiales bacterium 24-66-13]OZB02636.1 MAG: pantoate--beta-alanine ligase [Rhizobiales bacterium 39-66-18]HQS08053.1 pantoate--beta-alanine ligase [Xanthobacteraceae bacterium]HQS48773.1 pantoate--beta-alanine ligase [Xanthobacteraceae bacterium]
MAGKPEVVETVDALRAQVAAWRAAGEKVALVPTMGALHEGHIALVRQAKTLARRIVVSIFVNPTQFAPNEDFSRYPRTFDNDLALLAAEGVDVVYAPSAADMYPQGFATHFAMGGPALGLETDFRTHFFAGVAIVVSKLLIRTGPDYAMFGEKDYQQLKVVTRLAADLDLPVEIVPGATVREHDGLALSSRNRYLSPEERAIAPVIQQALKDAAAAIRAGTPADTASAAAADRIAAAGLKVDYVAARHAESLAPLAGPGEPIRLLAAAWLGKTRLIDNIGV